MRESIKDRVLTTLREKGEMSDVELALFLHESQASVRRSRQELVKAGLVRQANAAMQDKTWVAGSPPSPEA